MQKEVNYLYLGSSVVWNTWEALIKFSIYCPSTFNNVFINKNV